MLQALLQAELQAQLEALLRAQLPAKPEAELLTLLQAAFHPPCPGGDEGGDIDPDKTQRNLEERNVSRPRGSGLGRGGCGGRPRGRRGTRPASTKPRVEYWNELLAYIDSAYVKKFGHHYPWSNLARKSVWNLARVHSAWRVMALWDLYLECESWWARQSGWSIYGTIRDAGRLLEDPCLKQLAKKHEENLAKTSLTGYVGG